MELLSKLKKIHLMSTENLREADNKNYIQPQPEMNPIAIFIEWLPGTNTLKLFPPTCNSTQSRKIPNNRDHIPTR